MMTSPKLSAPPLAPQIMPCSPTGTARPATKPASRSGTSSPLPSSSRCPSVATSACHAAVSSPRSGPSRPTSSTAPGRATAASCTTDGSRPSGRRGTRSWRLQPPCSPVGWAAATGGHCSIAPNSGTINCCKSSWPCLLLLLPTQHLCQPSRKALHDFSFPSSQKSPELLKVLLSISTSPWGALQMLGTPRHP